MFSPIGRRAPVLNVNTCRRNEVVVDISEHNMMSFSEYECVPLPTNVAVTGQYQATHLVR